MPRLPDMYELPVPEIFRLEAPVMRPEAFNVVDLSPLDSSREPEKEFEAVPVERNWADVVTLPVACTPFDTSRPPEKELEPVLEEEMMPARVSVPLTLAVPPTSKVVSVASPALTPNLEAVDVNSKEPEPEAFAKSNWSMLVIS